MANPVYPKGVRLMHLCLGVFMTRAADHSNGGILKAVGTTLGHVLSPLIYCGSWLRGSRLFHPAGELYDAVVTVDGKAGNGMGTRLQGRALVRLSCGVSKAKREVGEVLGIAIRFGLDQESPAKFDLLFCSFRSFLLLPVAPFQTDAKDYFANTYFTISHFDTAEGDRGTFRLVPVAAGDSWGETRASRLAHLVKNQSAVFVLEFKGRSGDWEACARVALKEMSDLTSHDVWFNPVQAALGIVPTGLLNYLRGPVYKASQKAWHNAHKVGQSS